MSIRDICDSGAVGVDERYWKEITKEEAEAIDTT